MADHRSKHFAAMQGAFIMLNLGYQKGSFAFCTGSVERHSPIFIKKL